MHMSLVGSSRFNNELSYKTEKDGSFQDIEFGHEMSGDSKKNQVLQ